MNTLYTDNVPESLRFFAQQLNELGKLRIPCFCVVDFDMRQPLIYTINELQEANICVSFPSFKTKAAYISESQYIASLNPTPISITDYKKGYDIVKHNIQIGNSFLTNYTCTTPLHSDIDLKQLYHAAQSKYKILFKDEWLCFSPETFIEIKDGVISTRPMKGTIDASIPHAETIILNDPKETAEHYTIVDLMRNDLSIVAKEVVVQQFRYIDTIHTKRKQLLQTSSLIQGKLPENYNTQIGSILSTLLPAGSISGAPKKKTVDIIHEAESHIRGYYTGIAAYLDGYNLEACVLIRFIEKTPTGYVYKSGGGITGNSEMDKEYKEIIDKVYVPIF